MLLSVGADAATLAYNVTGPVFKTALEALPSVYEATVTLATGVYTVKIVTAGVPALAADGSGLTPSGTVTIAQV